MTLLTRDDPYVAKDAWRRAEAFFAISLIVSLLTGALGRVLNDTGAHRGGFWWLVALVTTVVVVNGYAVVWPKGTFHEDRPVRPLVQYGFGISWGVCMGLLFVSIHDVLARFGWTPAVTGVVAWFVIANFQGLWHQLFWDVKVSPPHNVLKWNAVKVGAAHLPNVTLSMIVLVWYGDARFLVAMQVIALTASAVGMRFPPPSYIRSPHLDRALPALEGRTRVPTEP